MTEQNQKSFYCSLPKVPERVFTEDVNPRRASENGTVLHYYRTLAN